MESKPLGNEREISPPSLDAFIPRCHLYLFRVRTAHGSFRVLYSSVCRSSARVPILAYLVSVFVHSFGITEFTGDQLFSLCPDAGRCSRLDLWRSPFQFVVGSVELGGIDVETQRSEKLPNGRRIIRSRCSARCWVPRRTPCSSSPWVKRVVSGIAWSPRGALR